MPRRAVLDPRLVARVIAARPLRYTTDAAHDDDRPAHVRAASGLATLEGRLVIVQDDAAFLGVVVGDAVTAIALPRGPGGRRRFEVALGNKHDKLDLESCLAIDGELWGFGSGSTSRREQLCRLRGAGPEIIDAAPLYAELRAAIGDAINIEGVAVHRDEVWLFHRGNTGPGDAGPAVARLALGAVRAWIAGGAPPAIVGVERYDLGAIAGVRLGFTDAVGDGTRVRYLAAAEASPDAIEDGASLGTQLGLIEGDRVVATGLVDLDGSPIKAEGLALDPRGDRVWIVDDPDDPERAARLCEVELVGPW